jgi:cellulose synthase/poly-beta-1,6-N-acetylglucosamine synthase-like glycosyltransferase
MSGQAIMQLVLTSYAGFWALYLLVLLGIARLKTSKRVLIEKSTGSPPMIAVIVPAGNAERVIARCLQALSGCNYPKPNYNLYVIADNSQDNTARIAAGAGAQVLTRNDGPRGKTYAIGWALTELTNRGVSPDLYLIVDSTALVEADFIAAIAQCWTQGEDIVSSHSILSPENQAWYARCLGLMLVHRNLQCWARERIGLSALLEGRGMAYSRHYIQRFGWSLALPKTQGSHPTEDWRHAVRAVGQGYRVAFADNARVSTPLRGSLSEATQQGARWERGRLLNAGTYAIRLLISGFSQRSRVKIFAALDAMQPPAAILAALCIAIAGFTYLLPHENHFFYILGYLPIALVTTYGMIVVLRGRKEGIGLSTVVWGPVYVIWRCAAFILAWAFLDRMALAGHGKPMANLAGANSSNRSKPSMSGANNLDEVARDAK